MDVSAGPVGKRRAVWMTPIAVALVFLAFGFGAYGLYLAEPPGRPEVWSYWTELSYRTLQLFVLQPPPLPDGVTPTWYLEVGRFLAPATTVFAVVVAASAAVRERMRWLLRRVFRRDYAVVIGTTAEARAVAQAKRAQRPAEGRRRKVFEVQSGDLGVLKTAGLKRAAMTLYACADDRDDVAANLAIALTAAAGRSDRPMRINVHVTDPTLALGLKARRLMSEHSRAPVVEFFSMDDMAAQEYVGQDPIADSAPPSILIAGAGAFGRGILVAFAKAWRDKGHAPGSLAVTLVDPHAGAIRDEMVQRWPVVANYCDITPVEEGLAKALAGLSAPPYRAYICYEVEHQALSAALTAVPLWRGGPGSLVVRMSRLASHGEAFEDQRLDNVDGRLRVADVARLASTLVARDPDPVRELARSMHERYLRTELPPGQVRGDRLSHRPWSELREDFRHSNHDLVAHIGHKLRLIGCTIAPRSAGVGEFKLTDGEIEILAPIEHERWVAERLLMKWKYHPVRDDERRRHDLIKPWEELNEVQREKDRNAVRDLETTVRVELDDLGLQIVRLEPARY